MADIVTIVISCVIFVIFIGVSFYIYVLYCHPQDKDIGPTLLMKILIVFAQALSWSQILLIPIDIADSGSFPNQTMEIVYSVIYPIILFISVFLIPFSIYLYETDQEDSIMSRVLWSLLFATITGLLFCAIIFISYIWLGVYTVDVNGISQTYRISAPLYILVCLSFAGWILLLFNGAMGMIHLPIDLITNFFNRPRVLSAKEAHEKKTYLQSKSTQVIDQGEELKEQTSQFQNTIHDKNWFSKKRQQSSMASRVDKYKAKVQDLEQQYEKFQMQLENTTVNVILYAIGMLLGFVLIVVSVLWILQILLSTIYIDSHPLYPLIDNLLRNLSDSNLSIFATIIYVILMLYLQICVVKGNLVFGLRIPFILKFHPMKMNKTFLNSFAFNVNLMLVASVATSQLATSVFPKYLQNSYLYKNLFGQVIFNLPLFGFVYKERVFLIAFLIVLLLAFVGSIIKFAYDRRKKIKQQTEIKKKNQLQLLRHS